MVFVFHHIGTPIWIAIGGALCYAAGFASSLMVPLPLLNGIREIISLLQFIIGLLMEPGGNAMHSAPIQQQHPETVCYINSGKAFMSFTPSQSEAWKELMVVVRSPEGPNCYVTGWSRSRYRIDYCANPDQAFRFSLSQCAWARIMAWLVYASYGCRVQVDVVAITADEVSYVNSGHAV